MRSYLITTTLFLAGIACAQLVRFLQGWPIIVAGFDVPVWASGVAAMIVGALAIWGVRLIAAGGRGRLLA